MTRIITLPAFLSTLGFIALDLVGVGIVGDPVAKWVGFDPSVLFPVSALMCVAGGYVAARLGTWGATAGSMVTGVEMTVYTVTGHLTPDIVPRDQAISVGIVIVLVASLGGAVLGAIGGWVALRRITDI